MTRTGFTLIELIIVIAIIAILATTVILVLNPAVILAEARDSQRIADLSQLNSALGLYLATSGAILNGGAADKCYVQQTSAAVAAKCGGRHEDATIGTINGRDVDGGGWIPVDFTAISGGSPLSALPVDPTSSATLFYSYATDAGSGFELNADMESARYGSGGSDDVETDDGGNKAGIYEIGNSQGLGL
jgi:prepilin-type N-terminal cleavage/methylation domain-containing protein